MNKNRNKALIILSAVVATAGVSYLIIKNMKSTSNNSENVNVSQNDTNIPNEEVNTVLENWIGTQAPMPIPIASSEIVKDSELVPFRDENTNLWGYKNQQGVTVVEPKYQNAGYFYDDIAPVQLTKNGKIHFIDKELKLTDITPVDYIEYAIKSKDLMIVHVGYKYGALKLDGSVIKPIGYDSLDKLAKDLGFESEVALYALE